MTSADTTQPPRFNPGGQLDAWFEWWARGAGAGAGGRAARPRARRARGRHARRDRSRVRKIARTYGTAMAQFLLLLLLLAAADGGDGGAAVASESTGRRWNDDPPPNKTLFIHNATIDRLRGSVALRLARPAQAAQPALIADKPWESFGLLGYHSICLLYTSPSPRDS